MVAVEQFAAQQARSMNIFGRPLTIFGLPVARETIFTNHHGQHRPRIEKRQRKLIVKTAFVKSYLHKNERILCLTTGFSPVGVLEQILTGPAFLFFKRAIFVFTTHRLLHIPIRLTRRHRSAISQVAWNDCRHIQLKGRNLVIDYGDGRQEVFPYMGRREKRKIGMLLESISVQTAAKGPLPGRVHLCPCCASALPAQAKFCVTCKLPFKTGLQARLRSLLIPGGGYFYSRYPLLGMVVAAVEAMLICFLAILGSDVHNGLSGSWTVLSLLALALAVEKAAAAYHAHQLIGNFIPEQTSFVMHRA